MKMNVTNNTSHDSKLEIQKSRRESLQQRNALLTMRLNSTNPQRMVKKPWRASNSHQQTPHHKTSPTITSKIPSPVRRPLRGNDNSPNRLPLTKRPTVDNTIHASKIPSPIRYIKNNNAIVTSSTTATTSNVTENDYGKIFSSPKLYKQLTLQDFEIGKKLGKGKFGKVYCVKHKESGFICALKAMDKSEIIQYNLQRQFRREVEIQTSLNHPNLTKLYGHFYDDKRVYLIMEYLVYGELYKLLRSHGPFNDIIASRFVYQIADALNHLHEKGIIHRDLKPENILIGFNNVLKLTDFGWSIINPKGVKRKTLCGTIDYLSPEMIRSREYDDTVDVWALGVLTYELVAGDPPFEEDSKELTYKRILKGEIRFPGTVSQDVRDLISRLLKNDPKERILLKEVMVHPWIMRNKPFW
ncbi:aurora kinase NDAI_0F01600 [Naumovozyma dairenensis CBS 421]|uniref:Aurora kinase n=1 Tax=Naumovozyma dairenensis (strain ATCC 10597 / BCRC 20456 / CBS 421 / NBRC 0211 / NRRL Y-12639) TaxID=1071378 RepID=G0WCG8_NAUDC|nr:hypothetical protein NDAI_0F01600 [Naumovozyma dairenensis CBS 421]CCD25479.1 hypothetical protein NDAI_0F01600 [Naumovozyma dairenensis CBS 421]